MPQLDLSHYKSILKNASAVEAAEKALSSFKPVDYDVAKWDKVVDAFEAKAVAQAKETVQKVDKEETDLKATLSNITDARPFEDLTSDEAAAANPNISKATEVRTADRHADCLPITAAKSVRPVLCGPGPLRPLLRLQNNASLTFSQAMIRHGRWSVPGALLFGVLARAESGQKRLLEEDASSRMMSWGGGAGAPQLVPCLVSPSALALIRSRPLWRIRAVAPLHPLFSSPALLRAVSPSSDTLLPSELMLTPTQSTSTSSASRACFKPGTDIDKMHRNESDLWANGVRSSND